MEGVYIDDHLIAQILSRTCHLRGAPARDDELIAASRDAYLEHGFPRALKQAFTKQLIFKAWGTEVHGETGRVGCSVPLLLHLIGVIVEGLALRRVSKKLVQKLTGLLIHPINHRRELLAVFHDTFRWIEELPPWRVEAVGHRTVG